MTNCKKLEKVIFDITKGKAPGITEESLEAVTGNVSGILYVTDDITKAREMKESGGAVLIYLHEGNKEQDFSRFSYFIEGFDDVEEEYYNKVYLREHRLPWTIAETERLIIREMTMEDKDALYALYADKSVTAFMEDLPADSEQQQEYIAEYMDKMYGLFEFGMWLVQKKDTGEVIGRVGFQNTEEEDAVELGFLIAPKAQGQGYAQEACKAAMEYMARNFSYLNIYAKCHKDNIAARAVCRKAEVLVRIVNF